MAILVAAALLAGIGIGYLLPHPAGQRPIAAQTRTAVAEATVQVSGFLDLKASPSEGALTFQDNGTCAGTGGYSDIVEGAAVVIDDDAGHTLAITNLGAGTSISTGCSFPFSATVPAGRGFYGITVSHRGTVKFSEDQLGSAQLTLGS